MLSYSLSDAYFERKSQRKTIGFYGIDHIAYKEFFNKELYLTET